MARPNAAPLQSGAPAARKTTARPACTADPVKRIDVIVWAGIVNGSMEISISGGGDGDEGDEGNEGNEGSGDGDDGSGGGDAGGKDGGEVGGGGVGGGGNGGDKGGSEGGGGKGGGEAGGGSGGPIVVGALTKVSADSSRPIALATVDGSAFWVSTASAASLEAVEPVETVMTSASTLVTVLVTLGMSLASTPNSLATALVSTMGAARVPLLFEESSTSIVTEKLSLERARERRMRELLVSTMHDPTAFEAHKVASSAALIWSKLTPGGKVVTMADVCFSDTSTVAEIEELVPPGLAAMESWAIRTDASSEAAIAGEKDRTDVVAYDRGAKGGGVEGRGGDGRGGDGDGTDGGGSEGNGGDGD